MKKTISLLLAMILVLGMTVSAAASSTDINTDKDSVKKGELVTVTVTLSEELKNITNFEYSVYFDPTCFSLKSSSVGTACSQTMLSALKTDGNGSFYSISFVDTTSEGVTVCAGVIYTLSFEAIKTVSESEVSSFELKQVSVMDTSWQQVADAKAGTTHAAIEIAPTEGEEEPRTYAAITLTLAAPKSVSRTAGTAFSASIYSTEWDKQAYKLLDCVVTIPSGLEVSSVTAGDRLSGGTLYYYLDGENKLRIVYNSAELMSTLSLTGSDFPAELIRIGLKTTSALTADQAVISIAGASLKLNSNSESEAAMNVLKIASAADAQGNTGSATVSFTGQSVISVTAAELFIGDGVDLIPSDRKGIVVSVNGISKENVKLTYKDGEMPPELFYSPEISALVGNPCYVAVVGSDVPVANFAKPANYEADTKKTAETVTFGDTNADGVLNAQDALNIINAWMRKTELTGDKDYLVYNVNSDSRINTFDALGAEEAFVEGGSLKIVTRAAALVRGS